MSVQTIFNVFGVAVLTLIALVAGVYLFMRWFFKSFGM